MRHLFTSRLSTPVPLGGIDISSCQERTYVEETAERHWGRLIMTTRPPRWTLPWIQSHRETCSLQEKLLCTFYVDRKSVFYRMTKRAKISSRRVVSVT